MSTKELSLNDILMILGRNDALTPKEYAVVAFLTTAGIEFSKDMQLSDSYFDYLHSIVLGPHDDLNRILFELYKKAEQNKVFIKEGTRTIDQLDKNSKCTLYKNFWEMLSEDLKKGDNNE